MFILVSYDIVNDKTRTRAAKLLLAYGRRVQKSVFECVIDERRYLQLKHRLEKLVDMSVDSVRYYSICRRCVGAIEVSGLGTVTEELNDAIII